MMNGAFFVESGNPSKSKPFGRLDMIKAKPGTFVARLTRFSGSLNCKLRRPC
jgi:pectate lyase